MRLPHLDIIRGGAALLVVGEHARSALIVPFTELGFSPNVGVKLFYALTGMGHSAVLVFFALSGYLVGGPMIARMRNGTFRALDYFCKRIVRLWIVVLPALVLTAFLDLSTQALVGSQAYDGSLGSTVPSLPRPEEPANYDVLTLIGNILFLQTISVPVYGSNGPMWSLANEFWYYMFVPMLTWAIYSHNLRWQKIAVALFACLIMACLPRSLVVLGLVWAAGAFAANATWSSADRLLSSLTGKVVLILPVVLALTANRLTGLKLSDLVIGLLVALALPAAAKLPSLGRWFDTRAKFLAEISYSLYLAHFPLVVAVSAILILPYRLQPDALGFLAFVTLVLACLGWGYFVYLLFESRTDRAYVALMRLLTKITSAKSSATKP
jgi:peptidoglycan/LPS O-acetylase OafA/YrhL